MKFSVERDSLLATLSHAHRIVARTSDVPILTTILLSATAGRVEIKATSTELVAETACPAEIEAGGQVAVPLAPLVELLRRLSAGTPLTFSLGEGGEGLTIRYRRSSATLPTLAAQEFSAFDMVGEAVELEVSATDLARLLETPVHVADPQSPWAFGVGVHLHFSAIDAALVGVATDQRRLTRIMLPAPDGAAGLPPITLATKPISEIVKLARDVGPEPLRLRITERLMSIAAGTTVLTTKLVDTRFPDYSRVIPSEMPRTAIVAAGELTAALQRTLVLADDKDRTVKCEIADGILSLNMRGQKGGSINETIEVEGGEGIVFGINASRAVEALAAIDADLIELASASPTAPVVMRAAKAPTVTCIVMPLLV